MAATSITEARDAHDQLTASLNRLQAFLVMTCGQARESFESMAPNLQDDYLMACTDLVQECLQRAKTIEPVLLNGESEAIGA